MRGKFVFTLQALKRHLEANQRTPIGEITSVSFATFVIEKMPKQLYESLLEEWKKTAKIPGINI